ncbi:MAG: 6,7-dimethyl-8-ribityllumazine synthase [Candidatus Gracilibacteria bacterium]|nr:6,7-dimethyl-8-ribityllumazine synthase [Candidatus Gracilibacteria bacterium]MDQ7023328.1 6,7-dimethyl-8-ribityllumazine synthase [Candidatus Gracilibacteria bacterium]
MSDYKIKKSDYSVLSTSIKIVILTSEFNRNYTSALEEKNIEFLEKRGFTNIEKFMVPGAFEIPAFLEKIIEKKNPDLIICFGVVIRGATTHYEMVAGESARGIMDISLVNPQLTIINGILTCENEKQVEERITDTYALSGLNVLSEIKKLG